MQKIAILTVDTVLNKSLNEVETSPILPETKVLTKKDNKVVLKNHLSSRAQ